MVKGAMHGKKEIVKSNGDVSHMRKTDKSTSVEKLRKDSRSVMTQAELIAVEMIFRQ